MQLWIILFYIVLTTDVSEQDEGGGGGGGETNTRKEERPQVEIPEAQTEVEKSSPVNARSVGVKAYHENDAHFQTLYPMTCGKTQSFGNSIARCAPDLNEIVIVKGTEGKVQMSHCSRVVICKYRNDGSNLCNEDEKIDIYFHDGRKKMTRSTAEDFTGFANIPVSEGDAVYHLEVGCQLSFEGGPHHLMHRFQNKGAKMREYMKKWPGFYLQPVFYHKRRLFQPNTITFGGVMHRGFKKAIEKSKGIQCKDGCDLGRLFYYHMKANALFYSKIFVDGAICEWIKICLHGTGGFTASSFYCADNSIVYIYIRYGFVVMPGALNGAPIRFLKSVKNIQDKDFYGETQIGFDFDGTRFVIWSVGREMVISSQNTNHDGHIILYFSHFNCLVKGKGIKNLGELNGIVYPIGEEDVSAVSISEGSKFSYGEAAIRETLGTAATEKPTPNVSAVAAKTTTPKVEAHLTGADATSVVRGRKGWVIIMMFAGLFVGSLVSLLFAGSLMYFARRNVYAVWYRGMYKRYGCDASGVTGGVTGSAFGTTTTGAYSTVAGTTTGGTTLGTTTGGTTTGGTTTSGMSTSGTTGGDSTTGGTSTSGTSTGGETSGMSTGGTSGTTGGTTGGTDVSGTSTGGDMVAM